MRSHIVVLIALLSALSHPAATQEQNFVFQGKPSEYEDYGYAVAGAAWQFADGAERVLFVCWENPAPSNEQARLWVQEQITKTWQRHTALEFRGWQACGDRNRGIRILFSDEGPRVLEFGRFLDGVRGGMILNHTFRNWGVACQKELEYCIRSIAAHEFGHALGFAHEQNRPDTPGECRRVHGQGQARETMLTPYDPGSIMNYCNPDFNNNGELSALDIKAAQKLYGSPR